MLDITQTKHVYQVSHHVQWLLSSQLILSELANTSVYCFLTIECTFYYTALTYSTVGSV